jgi:murein DD-endopeptidase MepM/ murein hydrolase activator NlpD
MKTSRIILAAAFAFLLSHPIHAQFNTIGAMNSHQITTTNPPKPHEAMTDSTVHADSIQETSDSLHDENAEVSDSVQYHMDIAPLVSLPLKRIHISSGFGIRKHPIYHRRMMHNGIDLSARYENVYSMFPGTVVRVGDDSRSGKFVTVRTGAYTISYCHLSQQLVKENDYVDAGTHIAVSGETGVATAPHLHLVAKKDGKAFDPTILLRYIVRCCK